MLNPKTLKDGVHTFGDGLRLKVRGSSRIWVLRVTFQGRTVERSLGSFPQTSTLEAREKAALLRAKIKSGEEERPKKKEAAPLLKNVWRDAVENQRRVKAWTNEKASAQWESTIRAYILPALGDAPVDQITRDDVLAILQPVWIGKAATAAKVRGRLETILNFCKAKGWRDGENPAAWKGNLELFLPPRTIAHTIEHFEAVNLDILRDKIIPELWKRKTSASCAVIFGCLTALRAGEFLHAHWAEIDDDVFTVPWQRMKTAKHSREDFRVPLSRQALMVLEAVRGLDDDVVFPGRIGRFNAMDTPRILIQRLTGTGATMHGMRSVFRDWCARDGVEFTVAEKCLSHAVGDRTVQAYLRDDLLDKRRSVMQKWSDAIFPISSEREFPSPASSGSAGPNSQEKRAFLSDD